MNASARARRVATRTTSSSARRASARTASSLKPARVTAFQNGVLIQDAQELLGPTTNKVRTPYSAHADKLPLSLQDHGHPVRFRNVWIRELPE